MERSHQGFKHKGNKRVPNKNLKCVCTYPKVERSLTPTNPLRLGFKDQDEEMKLELQN